jgi:hypothetical protein
MGALGEWLNQKGHILFIQGRHGISPFGQIDVESNEKQRTGRPNLLEAF